MDTIFNSDLANLHEQLEELERNLDTPEKLGEITLKACAGLLTILEKALANHTNGGEAATIAPIHDDLASIVEALQRSKIKFLEREAHYRTIVESQSELICRFTPDGTLTFCNEAFRQYYGELGINIPGDLTTFNEFKNATLLEQILTLTVETPSTEIDYCVTFGNSEQRWQHWAWLGTFDEQEQLLEIQAVGHDITDRKEAELAAKQHNRELLALHNATAALLTTLDPDALLGRIIDSAMSAIPDADKGMIHLIAQETGQLEMRASVGYQDPRIRRIKVPGSAGFVAKAVHDRTPMLYDDIQAHHSSLAIQQSGEEAARAAIVAPLILKNQVLGAISLESDRVGAFDQADLNLLASFAHTATAAIHNARLHAEVQKLAITDELTGLYNRRGFFELGQREVERARRFKRPLAALMLDIDHFKYINDAYGHSIGDFVLQDVAKRCQKTLRRIDILGRMGGDEFTILLPETNMYTAHGVAERLRRAMSEAPIETPKGPVSVSASLGIARATATTPDLDVLISRSDSALYAAKQAGRNRVEFG